MKRGIKLQCSVLFVTGIISALMSCASVPDYYGQIDAGVHSGAFENALASIDDEKDPARKNVYTPKNEILYYLDRGMIAHYAGLYENSAYDLGMAERLIEEAFTKSISQEIGSYLLNDNAKDYSGEDYEDLYVNVFNALNYYHNGSLESALVEIRRLNEKLVYLADKYETAIGKVLESERRVDTGKIPMEASAFSNSALARYLGVLFYRAAGQMDDVRIDYEELERAYELAPEVYYNNIPSSLEEELEIPLGAGRLNIIAFTGLSPVKEEESIIIPLPFPVPNNFARISLPSMVNREQTIQRAEVVLDTGQKFALELIEDMGAVARETFKSRYSLVVLKTAARTISKTAASAALAHAASENKDSSAGFVVGLFGQIFSTVSEQADTRLSRYFPCYALVGGINLEPGDYSVTVNFYGQGGLLYSQEKEVAVRENALNLEEFVCLN